MYQKRLRKLTSKAMENYEETVQQYEKKLLRQSNVVANLVNVDEVPELELKTLKSNVIEEFSIYDKLVSDFLRYLENKNTAESIGKMAELTSAAAECRKVTETFLKSMKKEDGTVRSYGSRSSSQSAKVQIARAKVAFAEKQAELERKKAEIEEQERIRTAAAERQKANLNIDLKLLEDRKEVAIAEAELEGSESGSSQSELISELNVPVDNSRVRTAEYVQQVEASNVDKRLNPTVTPYIPVHNDFTKFLLKKDILSSRLSSFTDQPEVYCSWKSTFQSVSREIGASPEEEIDLLVKWLGPSSRKQVISLKCAYVHNPVEGLQQAWSRLDERFGSAESVYHATMKKVESFPKLTLKDAVKLYDLSDILCEIEGLKEDPKYATTLSYFDSAVGVIPIINKLPHSLQEKWTSRATDYKRRHNVPFPPFSVCAQFVREQSTIRNDPGFAYETSSHPKTAEFNTKKKTFLVKKTDVDIRCPIHKANHSLENCRVFQGKSLEEKKKVLSDHKLCFKCFSDKHQARECKSEIKCDVCASTKHCTAMHGYYPKRQSDRQSQDHHGGEPKDTTSSLSVPAKTFCTEICENLGTASCAKIVLADVSLKGSNKSIRTYVILDDQSNRSLARPELFSCLGINAPFEQYTMNTCSGSVVATGRHINNCIVKSIDGSVSYSIPTLIECADLPQDKREICRPDQARYFPHLRDLPIQDVDQNADVLLLLGRDVIDAHHVYEQVTGTTGTPFAHRLGLGWVVVGEFCLDSMHSQVVVNVNKTYCLSNGRPSLFKPCTSQLSVIDQSCVDYTYDPVFAKSPDDNKISMSMEDLEFLQVMGSGFCKDIDKHWVAPLPFKSPRQRLPNNRSLALQRAKLFDVSLRSNEVKKQHCVEFMDKIFSGGHAEIAPPLKQNEECWFLPLFGVYHPKKPEQIRMVFDSSASFQGVSLNSCLLQGPDLVNSLVGVLVRFRSNQVAIMADIEQMFYSFNVDQNHRNFLRFLWYEDNDPKRPQVEYRMCRHVFGNSPSPAIATYGLRKSVESSEDDIRKFVGKDFYVDDGLSSLPSPDVAIDLLQRTQYDLDQHGLRLHKISSNNAEVMKAFPQEDLAKSLKDLNFEGSQLPQQRSLGIGWDLNSDSFTFVLTTDSRPSTKRGILSIVNSLFDPLGFLSPITIKGKLILRDVTATEVGWDDPVSHCLQDRWNEWFASLKGLENIRVPRPYFERQNLCDMSEVQLHAFSDASEKAIATVVYVVGILDSERHVGFLASKAKVAPISGNTIPRLELCAAVLAVELVESMSEQLGVDASVTRFYSDSRVVLGYINNQKRRFYTYVSNRVQRIRHSSSPEQWNFVPTHLNPADIGSRGVTPDQLSESMWFTGGPFLQKQYTPTDNPEEFHLLDPDKDSEVRPSISVKSTVVAECSNLKTGIDTSRFSRFSSWSKLVSALSTLKHIAMSFKQKSLCRGWHVCNPSRNVDMKHDVESFIIRQVQQEVYEKEIMCLKEGRNLDRSSSVLRFDPFLDESGIVRVGGRLGKTCMITKEKHPILLPGKHHVSKLLVSHYHELVRHQGRLLTEGSIRTAGFWITGVKRLVSSHIHSCVTCKKLRGKFEVQKMADLPLDRVEKTKPFTYVGVDVFGPWSVVSRRTRGGQANSKRWAVLFTCLTIRAIHIEVIEEMSSSAFINALRRFTAIRGKVKQFRSDRGTNFVGATDDLCINAINVEDEMSKKYLYDSNSVWLFNPPHSSHMGGSWERMIGIARRILDSMLSQIRSVTHDVLVTLMAEVSAIINSRPIVPVSDDESDPEILSPSVLLTMKFADDKVPAADQDVKNLYKSQWRQVRYLADMFWLKWKRDYLHSLQVRRKWNNPQDNLEPGNVVLIKEKEVGRCFWPIGRVQRVFPSDDGRVRKVELFVSRNGKESVYIRPIVDLVKLI